MPAGLDHVFSRFSRIFAIRGQGNLIPVTRQIAGGHRTPLRLIAKYKARGNPFCESVKAGASGRYSFVGCNPRAVIRKPSKRWK